MGTKQEYSSCFDEDLLVGIKVDAMREVTAGSEVTPVPLSSPLVSGLLNLRGQIVTEIDLRRCLELGDRPANQPPVHVIMWTDEGCVSLLVDQVGEVLQVDDDDFETSPRTLRGRLRELITGAYKLDGRLLLVLDTDRVLACSTSHET